MSSQAKRNVILLVVAVVVIVAGIILALQLNKDDGGEPVANHVENNGANNTNDASNGADNDGAANAANEEEPTPAVDADEPAPAEEPAPVEEPAEEPAAPVVEIDSLLGNASFEGADLPWVGRGGNAQVTITNEEAYSGTYSLKTSGRTLTWEGPMVDVTSLLEKGKTYYVATYLKYNGVADSQVFNLQFETQSEAGTEYPGVASVEVKNGEWTLLEGEYTIPDNVTQYSLYVEVPWKADEEVTETDRVDFYIDDVIIREVN